MGEDKKSEGRASCLTKWINARISAVGKDQAAGASSHPQVPGHQRTKARWGREQLRKNLSQVWSSLVKTRS